MTAVKWLVENLKSILPQSQFNDVVFQDVIKQAKEMEKQQIIDAGNSCAIKQHLHNYMIDEMSNAEAMVFTQIDNLTFGEQYYNETFNK